MSRICIWCKMIPSIDWQKKKKKKELDDADWYEAHNKLQAVAI